MYLLVNELSFQAQANELMNSHQLMNDLISVIRSLRPIRGGRSDPDFNDSMGKRAFSWI